MKRILLTVIAVLLPLSIYAQQPTRDKKTEAIKTPAELADEDMASSIRSKSFTNDGIQYGGWITPALFDQWSRSTTLAAVSVDTRIWIRSYLWKDSFLYVRGKDTYTGIIKNQGFPPMKKNDNILDLDAAYIGAANESKSFNIFLGRKFFSIGTGLVLNGRGDGGEIDIYSSVVNMMAFGMYTGLLAKESNPYGLSSRDNSDGSKRVFAGGMISRTILNQTLYLFGVAQIDKQKDATAGATPFKYDSQYWGGGAKGFIGKGLSYYGEFIYETGQSYAGTEKKSIAAYAINSGIDYYFDAKMNPTLILQYASGSGDKDSSGKAPNGNISGSDNRFIYFGTYTGGYALRPYLSNVHVLRGGFSLSPFSESDKIYLKRMYVIFKYSLYFKDQKDRSLASGDATAKSAFAGHGLDLAYKWVILSDISFFMNGAMLLAGPAFSSPSYDNRYFAFGGFNLSF